MHARMHIRSGSFLSLSQLLHAMGISCRQQALQSVRTSDGDGEVLASCLDLCRAEAVRVCSTAAVSVPLALQLVHFWLGVNLTGTGRGLHATKQWQTSGSSAAINTASV